jgi:hypothetical protein
MRIDVRSCVDCDGVNSAQTRSNRAHLQTLKLEPLGESLLGGALLVARTGLDNQGQG